MLSETEENYYDIESSSSDRTSSDGDRMSVPLSEETERQYRLHQQTEAYLHGKISAKDLEKVVAEEDVDYEQASFGLTSAASEVAKMLVKLL